MVHQVGETHDGVAGLVPRPLQRLDEVVGVDTQGTIGVNPGKLLPAGRGKDRPPFTLLELLDQPLGRGRLHQARRQLDCGRAFLGGGHPLGVAAVDHDQQTLGLDLAQGVRELLGRECRGGNVKGFDIVWDQVVPARWTRQASRARSRRPQRWPPGRRRLAP